jgi:hypothetical protein
MPALAKTDRPELFGAVPQEHLFRITVSSALITCQQSMCFRGEPAIASSLESEWDS